MGLEASFGSKETLPASQYRRITLKGFYSLDDLQQSSGSAGLLRIAKIAINVIYLCIYFIFPRIIHFRLSNTLFMNTLIRIMIDFYVTYLLPTNVYGIHIRVHEFAGMDHFVMCLCVC